MPPIEPGKDKLALPKKDIPQVRFPSVGTGIMRSTASYIVLLLSLESPGSRADVVASALTEMRINIDDVADRMDVRMCKKCHLDLATICKRRGHCER